MVVEAVSYCLEDEVGQEQAAKPQCSPPTLSKSRQNRVAHQEPTTLQDDSCSHSTEGQRDQPPACNRGFSHLGDRPQHLSG